MSSSRTTQRKSKSKSRGSSAWVECPICEGVIVDGTHQSIQYEGLCDSWLHRRCAGLSKTGFVIASKSKKPSTALFVASATKKKK